MKTRRSTGAPRIHLASLGCAKNLVDSEQLLARLASAGGLVGAAPDEADIVIVNTCGFIAAAKEESIRTILDYSKARADGTIGKLIVMGCLPERDQASLRAELPDVDLIVGLHGHADIVRACGLDDPAASDGGRLLLTPAHFAYLRVSDGCDNRCSYCTIPMIRGPFHSRPPQDILKEAEELATHGVKELVLIGQDTSSYGKDLATAYPIHRLLHDLASIDGVRWLRLLYTHPAHFSDSLIAEYADNPKLCAYADIPLQHLHDDILRRMGRRSTQAEILDLIGRLRARVPHVALRTTFIVGFPGETDDQFKHLLDLVRELRFTHLGAFAYSPEPGTPAATYPDPVAPDIVEERLDALMLEQQRIVFEDNEALVGEEVTVLMDEPTDEDGVWIGRTEQQAPDVDSVTYVMGQELEPGQFVDVRIIATEDYDLLAQT